MEDIKKMFSYISDRLDEVSKEDPSDLSKGKLLEINNMMIFIKNMLDDDMENDPRPSLKPEYLKDKPKPPTPPLSRVIKDGSIQFCNLCKSSMSRKRLFSARTCDNPECTS